MYGGAGIQQVFLDYGSNVQNTVLLMADIVNTESNETIKSAYQAQSSIPITLPFITGDPGLSLAQLFDGYHIPQPEMGYNWSQIGAQIWIVLPNRQFFNSYYTEDVLRPDLDSALARAASPVGIKTGVAKVDKMQIVSMVGSKIDFRVEDAGRYEVSVFNVAGQLVKTRQTDCRSGRSMVDIGRIAKGSYVVRIKGSGATLSKACIFGSH